MGAAPANTPLTVGKAVPAMPSRASPDHIVQDPVVRATLAPDVAGGPEHAPNVGGPAPVPNQEGRPPTAPSGETGLPQGQAIQAEVEAVELPICLICQDAVIVLSSIVLSSIDNCVVLKICQDTMDEAETVLLQLHCGHWFHDDCIRRGGQKQQEPDQQVGVRFDATFLQRTTTLTVLMIARTMASTCWPMTMNPTQVLPEEQQQSALAQHVMALHGYGSSTMKKHFNVSSSCNGEPKAGQWLVR